MMFPFMTLEDGTEIVHSHLLDNGKIKVYIETPVKDGFHSATIYLPGKQWEDVQGYCSSELAVFMDIIQRSRLELLQRASLANVQQPEDQKFIIDEVERHKFILYLAEDESVNKSRAMYTDCTEAEGGNMA